jgi:hypothetical protein
VGYVLDGKGFEFQQVQEITSNTSGETAKFEPPGIFEIFTTFFIILSTSYVAGIFQTQYP